MHELFATERYKTAINQSIFPQVVPHSFETNSFECLKLDDKSLKTKKDKAHQLVDRMFT